MRTLLALFVVMAMACKEAPDEAALTSVSTAPPITQADVDKLLAQKKPGACLAVRPASAAGKRQSFCRQILSSPMTRDDCLVVKQRLGSSHTVTWYATKHCSELIAKKSPAAAATETETEYAKHPTDPGEELLAGETAPTVDQTPTVIPPEIPQTSPDPSLATGGGEVL